MCDGHRRRLSGAAGATAPTSAPASQSTRGGPWQGGRVTRAPGLPEVGVALAMTVAQGLDLPQDAALQHRRHHHERVLAVVLVVAVEAPGDLERVALVEAPRALVGDAHLERDRLHLGGARLREALEEQPRAEPAPLLPRRRRDRRDVQLVADVPDAGEADDGRGGPAVQHAPHDAATIATRRARCRAPRRSSARTRCAAPARRRAATRRRCRRRARCGAPPADRAASSDAGRREAVLRHVAARPLAGFPLGG